MEIADIFAVAAFFISIVALLLSVIGSSMSELEGRKQQIISHLLPHSLGGDGDLRDYMRIMLANKKPEVDQEKHGDCVVLLEIYRELYEAKKRRVRVFLGAFCLGSV